MKTIKQTIYKTTEGRLTTDSNAGDVAYRRGAVVSDDEFSRIEVTEPVAKTQVIPQPASRTRGRIVRKADNSAEPVKLAPPARKKAPAKGAENTD